MLRRLFTLISALSALACFLILFAGIWSIFGNVDCNAHLPGGIELSASGCAGKARLGITRWGAQTDQWWKNRIGTGRMNVTGKTEAISQGPTPVYATRVSVDFGVREWHGVEWRSGAMSKDPTTQSVGVMSMALVPYFSSSIPWTYALAVSLILPAAWITLRLRRRKPLPGCCKVCGYDLRGAPGKCPECGTMRG